MTEKRNASGFSGTDLFAPAEKRMAAQDLPAPREILEPRMTAPGRKRCRLEPASGWPFVRASILQNSMSFSESRVIHRC